MSHHGKHPEVDTAKARKEFKRLDKEAKRSVPAYRYTTKSGEKLIISCPKRLLKVVQEDGRNCLLKDFELF